MDAEARRRAGRAALQGAARLHGGERRSRLGGLREDRAGGE